MKAFLASMFQKVRPETVAAIMTDIRSSPDMPAADKDAYNGALFEMKVLFWTQEERATFERKMEELQ